MENGSKKILSVKTLDKRETDRKSGNLEKAGFIRGIQEVQDNGLHIAEVVTDAHIQIGALMSKYKGLKIFHFGIMLVCMNVLIMKLLSYIQKRITLH
jgi:hypothetical protein